MAHRGGRLAGGDCGEVAYYAGLTELFFVRRYAAKLAYELDFFEDPLAEGRNQRLYTTTLSAATHFVYRPRIT